MSGTISSFGAEEPTVRVVEGLLRDGVVILEDLLTQDVVDRLNEELLPHFGPPQADGDAFRDPATATLAGIWGMHAVFSEELMLQQRALELADAILLPQIPLAATTPARAKASYGRRVVDPGDGCRQLVSEGSWDPARGPNCHHYRINAGMSIRVHPGSRDQPLHRDLAVWEPFVPNDPATPQYELIFHLALTDFTTANGATRFVPGSHRWPKDRLAGQEDVACAEMPAGAVVAWLGRTLHGYGANRTEEPRHGILYALAADWLTQEENQYLTAPPEFARTLPLQAIQLLGYRASTSGNYVKGRSLDNLLEPRRSGAP